MFMFMEEGLLVGVMVCDVGCGIGLFLILFVKEGVIVFVSDIFVVMVVEVEMKVSFGLSYEYLV